MLQSCTEVQNGVGTVSIQREIGHGVRAHCDRMVFDSVAEARPHMEKILDWECRLLGSVFQSCWQSPVTKRGYLSAKNTLCDP
jgi:hypothetical protein